MYWYRHDTACDFELLCFCWSTRYLHHITSSKIRNCTRLHRCRCLNRTMLFHLQGVPTALVRRYFGLSMLYGGDITWNSKRRGVRNPTWLLDWYQELGWVRNRTPLHVDNSTWRNKFDIASVCKVWLFWVGGKKFELWRGYSYGLRKFQVRNRTPLEWMSVSLWLTSVLRRNVRGRYIVFQGKQHSSKSHVVTLLTFF